MKQEQNLRLKVFKDHLAYNDLMVLIKDESWKNTPLKVDGFEWNGGLHIVKVRDEPSKVNFYVNLEDTKLILKPMSMISDEDMLAIARIIIDHKIKKITKVDNGTYEVMSLGIKYKIYNYYESDGGIMVDIYRPKLLEWKGCEVDPLSAHYAYEYLKERGYAVPLYFGIAHHQNGMNALQLHLAVEDKTEVVNE